MSTRLTEIRAFSDLFSEFRASLEESGLPLNTKLLVLCNRPSYEFVAFQARRWARPWLQGEKSVESCAKFLCPTPPTRCRDTCCLDPTPTLHTLAPAGAA